MESPENRLLRLLVERDPASPGFSRQVRATVAELYPEHSPELCPPLRTAPLSAGESVMWGDVFVQQPLPWWRFLQSALLHATAVALIWMISLSWIRQQNMLAHAAFDRASLVTYSPEEYLPPLDTGASEPPKVQTADPAYAKQPILSVPPEADNRSQTIVVPPDIKLDRDVAVPNIIATGTVTPAVPLDATPAPLSRIVAPDAQVVAPAPDVQFAPERVVRTAMKADVIAPPPEVTRSTKGQAGLINIGPSDIVAPAPQLTLAEQHAMSGRGGGRLPGGSLQPVGPPPSVATTGGARASGRLIALGIHPVAPTGPVAVPGGNRRGTFAATPHGKANASGTPDLAGSGRGTGNSTTNSNSLPTGLYVGGVENSRDMASISSPPAKPGARVAAPVSDDKITDVDRQVFGGKRPYAMTLNMPNLNSATGSWEIRFAELAEGKKEGQLEAPVAMEKSDPGYPLELIRANVHGMVTLYAVIQSDGKVGEIRIISSADERLDSYATAALARCKFAPAERAGKPVALEAVVKIPFRVRPGF